MVTIESESDFYDVFEILGKGTFGEVVKSWKRSTGEMVAIKILKNDSYRSRIIKNELKLLQTMSEVDSEESHIVQFHEFFHDELKFYLVFELLEQNLFDFQKEHNFSPLPVRHIRTVTTQVLRALAKLKELSIIHADLKPENIMLVDQVRYPFRVKVIDFGSASIFNEVRYVKEPYIQSRFYRAPEILLGLPFSGQGGPGAPPPRRAAPELRRARGPDRSAGLSPPSLRLRRGADPAQRFPLGGGAPLRGGASRQRGGA